MAAVCGAAAFAGCGPDAAVWVRIEAPFRVPEEADAVHVVARRVADDAIVYDTTHALGDGAVQFPVEFALTNENPQNVGRGALEVSAEVLHEGALAAPWAQAKTRADVEDGRVTHAVLRVCDCTP